MKRKAVDIGTGNYISVSLKEVDRLQQIYIDDILGIETSNKVHAEVMFNMISDHITEYLTF